MKPHLRSTVVAIATALFAPPVAVSAQPTLVNDPFTSAAVSSNVVTSDTTWTGVAGILSIPTESGAGTLNAGPALQFVPFASWSTVRGAIPGPSSNPVPGAGSVVMGTGDTLTATFRLRIASTPAAFANGIRIGLGSSAGTYGVEVGTGGTNGGPVPRLHDGAVAHGNNVAIATTGTLRTIDDNAPRTLTLTLKRTNHTTVDLIATMVNGSQSTTWTGAETGAVLSVFDTLLVSQGTTTMTLRLDDAKITYTPRSVSESHPLARWRFDEPELTGIDAQIHAWDDTLYGNELQLRLGNTLGDRHTAAGAGVSGRSHDRALLADSRGVLDNPQSLASWQNMPHFTIAGWVKIASVPTAGTHLLDWEGASGVKLWFPADGKLALRIGADTGSPVDFTTTNAILTSGHVGQWVYLAVTYRANATSNGVRFYRANTSGEDVTLIASSPGDTTVTGNIRNTGAGDLHLGSDRSAGSKFPGELDDFMIHERELNQTNLRSYRLSGMNPTDYEPRDRLINGKFTVRPPNGDRGDGWGNHTANAVAGHAYVTSSADYRSAPGAQFYRVTSLGTTNPFSMLVQDVMLQAGKTYKASVWLRSKSTDSPAGGKIRFHLRKKHAHFTPYATRTFDLIPDGVWREYSIVGGSHNGDIAYFAIEFLTTGTVWIDDASLVEIDAPTGVRETLSRGPVPGQFFGIHLNKLSGNSAPAESYHPFWPSMGQKTLRLWDTGTRWGDIERSQGNFDWSRFNLFVNKAIDNAPNASVIYTLGMPPTWAVNPDPKHKLWGNVANQPNTVSSGPPDIDSNWGNWIDYVTAVHDESDGRVRYWEIWNEANVSGSNDNNDPIFYTGTIPQMVELAHAAATVLKTDPANKILSPNVTVSGWQWLDQYLMEAESRGTAYLDIPDIYSVHLYSGRTPELRRPFVAALKDIIGRYPGQGSKPIWNTEGAERISAGDDVSVEDKAGIVSRGYITQWIAGISNYSWYTWEGSGDGIPVSQKIDDVYSDVLPPGGVAYRETAKWLVGADVIAKTVTPTGAGTERWIVEITRPGTYKGYIVWDTAYTAYDWTVPTSWGSSSFKLRKLDATSSTVSSGATIQIGPIPVLLEYGEAQAALIDFGSSASGYPSGSPWNNVNVATPTGTAIPLVDANGNPSDLTLTIDSPFNTAGNGNTNGTTSPGGDAAAYPSTATRDSLFGNTASFSGQASRTPVMTIGGLDPGMRYKFRYFASRTGTPTQNRTTTYTLTGATIDIQSLNAQDNVSTVAESAWVHPKFDGTVELALTPHVNNNTDEEFTYLGVLEIRVSAP